MRSRFFGALVGSLIKARKLVGRSSLIYRRLSSEGWAEVLDIETCPDLEACPDLEVVNGQRITGTFQHTSGELFDLKLESKSEPIGVTAQRPFWSVDRNDWVAAIDLEIGEPSKLKRCLTLPPYIFTQLFSPNTARSSIVRTNLNGDNAAGRLQNNVVGGNSSHLKCGM